MSTTTIAWKIAVIGSVGLLGLACSERALDNGGRGDAGGTGGLGGTGGTSGTGGAGGMLPHEGAGRGGTAVIAGRGGRMDLELPDCVQALIASCPVAGSCMSEQTDAGGALSELCFSSGVHATFEGQIVGTSGMKAVHVSKADGTPCYTFRTSFSGGEQFTYTWTDAAGQVVATGMNGAFLDPPGWITCAGGGQTRACALSSCCDIGVLGSTTCGPGVVCQTGACP